MLLANGGETKTGENRQQKLALIDRDLKFDKYALPHQRKAGKKLIALTGISKFMILAQRTRMVKAFIDFWLTIDQCFAGGKLMPVQII